MINIKTFEVGTEEYSSCYDNALRKASKQIKEDINRFLKENDIHDIDVMSIDIKHKVTDCGEGYENCNMTAVLCYKSIN